MMGVQEYFAYDPNEPPIRSREPYRLFGWQLDEDSGLIQKMTPGPGGRLWSRHLDSLLVPDGPYLRLYDREGHLRRTKGEVDAPAPRYMRQGQPGHHKFSVPSYSALARYIVAASSQLWLRQEYVADCRSNQGTCCLFCWCQNTTSRRQ